MADPIGREIDRVSVRVLPNTRHFLPSLQSYLRRIESRVTVEIPTSLDTSGLQAEAQRAARAIEQSTQVDLPVDVDSAAAEARLAAVARPRSVPVRVDVDRSALRAVTGTIDAAVSSLGSVAKFGGIGLLAGGGISGLTSLTIAATQAAGAVGVLAAGMLSAGGAAGILTVAVAGQAIAMAEQQKDIKTATDALAKLEPGTEEYAEKLQELNGLQRTFNREFGPTAAALDSLKDAWARFMAATRTQTLGLMATSLSTITGVLPQLPPVANAAAREMRGLVEQFRAFTRSAGFADMLEWIRTNGVPNLGHFARALGNVAMAFGPIIAVFTPFANQMMRGLEALSREFRTFINAAAESGALRDFAAGSVAAFKALAGLVADVAMSLVAIGRAASAAGGGVLGGLGQVFDRLREFLESATGQGALKGFFAGVGEGFAALSRAMGPVGSALGSILPALGSILGSVGKAAGAALRAIAEPLALLAGPLADVAAVLATGIARALRQMGPGLEMLAAGLGRALVGMVEALAPIIPQLARSFGRLALALANTLVPVLPSLVRAFKNLLPVLPALLRSMANLLPVITPLLARMARQLPAIARDLTQGTQGLRSFTTWLGSLKGELGLVLNKLRPLNNLLQDFMQGAVTGNWGPMLDQLRGVWEWLDGINNKMHEWMVKLDNLPGIEVPGIGDEEHRKPLGPLDKTAPHGPMSLPGNTTINITAHDYEDFRRQAARRQRRRNVGGVQFAP